MRSGDYPVKNTRYVGIIVMLSGIKNIPRIHELQEVQEQYLVELEQVKVREEQELKAAETLPGPAGAPDSIPSAVETTVSGGGTFPSDQAIVVPGGRREKRQSRSIPLFDGLTISRAPVRYGPGEAPIRGDGSPADLTRKTTVREPMAPRDSVFGLKDVKLDRRAPSGRERGAGGKPDESIPAPRESVPGEDPGSGKGIPKADDSSFTGREIRVKAKTDVPDDRGLMSPERGLAGISRGAEGPAASDRTGGGEERGKPAGRPKKKKGGDGTGGDDESISWIR
jgi:hypothetical protein